MIRSIQKPILVKFHVNAPFGIKFHFGVHVLVQSEIMYNTPLNIFSRHIVEDFHMIFNGYAGKLIGLTTLQSPKPGNVL